MQSFEKAHHMSKVGNFVQRDYQNRFRSQRKPTWSDYNNAWNKRRQASAKRMEQMRDTAYNFATINTQASQANTLFAMMNRNRNGAYAVQAAALARINVLV